MTQDTSSPIQAALVQVDQDIRNVMDLLLGDPELVAAKGQSLDEIKQLAAQAQEVIQEAMRKAEST